MTVVQPDERGETLRRVREVADRKRLNRVPLRGFARRRTRRVRTRPSRFPAKALRDSARIQTQAHHARRIFRQSRRHAHECIRVAKGRQQATYFIHQTLAGRRIFERDYRPPACHRLHRHIAKCFSQARRRAYGRGCIMSRQILSGTRSGKDDFGWRLASDARAGPSPTMRSCACGFRSSIAPNALMASSRFFSGAIPPTYMATSPLSPATQVRRRSKLRRAGENRVVSMPRETTSRLCVPWQSSWRRRLSMGTSVARAGLWNLRK